MSILLRCKKIKVKDWHTTQTDTEMFTIVKSPWFMKVKKRNKVQQELTLCEEDNI